MDLSIFDLERNGPIPFNDWWKHQDKLPIGVWNSIMNNTEEMFPTLLGYRPEVGYYVLCSGQGPFVMWMENPQQISGPHPFKPKPGEKRYDYDGVQLEKKSLDDKEWNLLNNE